VGIFIIQELEMKKFKDTLDPHRELIEIGLSAVLFCGLVLNAVLFTKYDFFNLVYALLAYIVILELVRMVGQYMFSEHRQMRIVIDTFIIFILREVILTYSDKNMGLDIKGFYIVGGLFIIYMLFNFRKRVMVESPFETDCKKCLTKDSCNFKD
jgi:uncharacterized membrane protein (DUF373 family)